jgi:hypothetical protein
MAGALTPVLPGLSTRGMRRLVAQAHTHTQQHQP